MTQFERERALEAEISDSGSDDFEETENVPNSEVLTKKDLNSKKGKVIQWFIFKLRNKLRFIKNIIPYLTFNDTINKLFFFLKKEDVAFKNGRETQDFEPPDSQYLERHVSFSQLPETQDPFRGWRSWNEDVTIAHSLTFRFISKN